tara:strand:+ start:44266 stop:44973 length:708 start_codon:yes stop_codon:yes gene_type:complete
MGVFQCLYGAGHLRKNVLPAATAPSIAARMSDAPPDPEAIILDAARDCYLSAGIDDTSMRDVAARAGVARSTVYRYYPGRDELLVAVIKQEMFAANARIRLRLAKFPAPADQVVEGMLLALREIPRRPLLRAVFASEEGSRARRVVWSSDVIVRFGEELMEHVVRPAQDSGLLQDAVPPEVLVEWIYRLLLSFLTLPSNWIRSDAQLRATLHALLVPVLLNQQKSAGTSGDRVRS